MLARPFFFSCEKKKKRKKCARSSRARPRKNGVLHERKKKKKKGRTSLFPPFLVFERRTPRAGETRGEKRSELNLPRGGFVRANALARVAAVGSLERFPPDDFKSF
jgi:hypothetical protein